MSQLTPHDRRLQSELEGIKKLMQDSSFFHFETEDTFLPEEYTAIFTCLGLIAKPPALNSEWRQTVESHQKLTGQLPPWLGNKHVAHIYLPRDYPAMPPQVRFLTPIFHPNIKTLTEDEWVHLAGNQVGNVEQVRQALETHPELRKKMREQLATYICLDELKPPREGGNYSPRLTLYDICCELGQMIMLKRYNLKDPLDRDAATWVYAALQRSSLPIDTRSFLDRVPLVKTVIDPSPIIQVLSVE